MITKMVNWAKKIPEKYFELQAYVKKKSTEFFF